MWAATALVATAATLGFVWKQQQQRITSHDSSVRSSASTSSTSKGEPSITVAGKNSSRDTTTSPRAEEEKKDAEDLLHRRPVTEIALTGDADAAAAAGDKLRILTKGLITIVHGSVTGSCAKLALQLEEALTDTMTQQDSDGVPSYRIQVAKMDDFDWWDEFLNEEEDVSASTKKKAKNKKAEILPKLIILLPTYTSGTWPPSATALQSTFSELQTDWRIEKFPLKKKLHVGIFGMGSSAYGDDTMGKPAREAQMNLHKLGAKTIVRLAIGDDSVGTHAQTTFSRWTNEVIKQIQKFDGTAPKTEKPFMQQQQVAESAPGCCGGGGADKTDSHSGGCCQTNTVEEEEVNPEDFNEEYNSEDDVSDDDDDEEPAVVDLEDMGDAIAGSGEKSNAGPPEMVTPSQAVALKKEGYKLIGTHSAVKLCRWTKHQLRGRGGCYKHTFYGITSYQCMEATPSLACANKCVFCWRHHKNPVGKEWRWKTDDPHFIVDTAVNTHVQMIREAKGIPGVKMDRWKEALTVRHCALSLVGEPIMYPRIDDLLGDLHNRKISTFLVTNGQHPQAIGSLRPITQLYVSVDAPTETSLIEIDRPLFNDAWDRLKESLVSLKEKGQRTVARLTVVKGWNSDEIGGYAKLIALGRVSLVEVKGVTFCGKSDASNLNMSNSPWHHEVVQLTTNLKKELDKLRLEDGPNSDLPEYGLACEHRHSCSVLLARVDQFAHDDPVTSARTWRTWIDYDKFHELAKRNAEDPSFKFSVKDYVADTPSWALVGAAEEGFDPTDTRHRKARKYPKYAQFDKDGVPTHDHENEALSADERNRLTKLMDEKKSQIGCGTTVTEMKDGAKEIQDASLMFRGLVMTK